MISPVRSPSGPHLVRIRFGEGPVELVRNSIKIMGEQAGVDIQGHGCGRMPKHLLDSFDVRAGGHGEAGGGVPQLV